MGEIKFSCIKCGNCCRVGFVYLTRTDIKNISKRLGLQPEEFKKKYTTNILWLGRTMKWAEKGGCVFLKNNMCSIYESRPEQCSTYPYWKKLDIKRAKEYCSGIRQPDK